MDNPAIVLSSIALVFSIFALIGQLTLLFFRLDARITDIKPSTTNEEGFSTFLARLVIVNRASVGRTVCGIKINLLRKYRKSYSIEPILDRYELSGQNVISVTANPVTINQTKSLRDSIFRLPLDISPGQSTIQWITLKVSPKSQVRQGYGNIRGHLTLLNVSREPLAKKIGISLKI